MKSIRTGIILLGGLLLTLAPGQIQAQTYSVSGKVSFSGTMYEQGASNDNGTTTTTKAPTKVAITTANLLLQLAEDEYYNGNPNFPTNKVPKGAVLEFYNDSSGIGFEIEQGTNQLADVSADGIMTCTENGTNVSGAGTVLDAGGAPFTESSYFITTVTYASPTGNTTNPLNIAVTGLATSTGKATTPNNKTGNLTVSASISFSDGTGGGTIVPTSGTFAGQPIPVVLTGFTFTASGSATANNGNGTD
jgi:hypothetical protein